MANRHRVLVIGGGYGGLYAARTFAGAALDVTLVDRRNHHVFSPLLYQVATGALAPSEIAQPLRLILHRYANVRVLLGEAVGIDARSREVTLADGTMLPYDSLIVATGVHHSYLGHDEWAELAPGLKTLEDALAIRARILDAFEAAELETDSTRQHALMSFVIVGGGPTGVELAGALCEIARDALPRDFRNINTEEAQVFVVEAADRILPTYPRSLSQAAARQLAQLGATIRTSTKVTGIDADGVTVADPAGGGEAGRIEARTVLWAAGVAVEPFGRALAAATGAATDRAGRIEVQPDLTIAGHPEIRVVGDLAVVPWSDRTVPGVAQGGIQGGRYAARAIVAGLDGVTLAPFRFRDLGELATIGRLRAVADFRRLRISGSPAWFLWLGIHIFWLIGLQNRALVMLRWVWSFLTRGRGNRLITGAPAWGTDARRQG